ncbi:UNVERIFIED_CONTAM: hypothetical protein FKN15_007876 [Acipenser sinensis]
MGVEATRGRSTSGKTLRIVIVESIPVAKQREGKNPRGQKVVVPWSNNRNNVCRCGKKLLLSQKAKELYKKYNGTECLKNLAILSIEKGIVKALKKNPCWYDLVIDHFTTQKERRADFINKLDWLLIEQGLIEVKKNIETTMTSM